MIFLYIAVEQKLAFPVSFRNWIYLGTTILPSSETSTELITNLLELTKGRRTFENLLELNKGRRTFENLLELTKGRRTFENLTLG